MADVHFEVISSLGKKIRVTKSYWNFIITVKHPMMAGKEELVKDALINADEIRRSSKDKDVSSLMASFLGLPNQMSRVLPSLLNTSFAFVIQLRLSLSCQ